jgi:glycine hydroxymethyltransferase
VTSGIRIGMPLVTSRGMDEGASRKIAGFICDILDDAATIDAVAEQVKTLCSAHPLYTGK